jgi:hypothetical protein
LISGIAGAGAKEYFPCPLAFFDNTKSEVLCMRIMNDVEGARNPIGTGPVQLVWQIRYSIGAVDTHNA